MAKVWIHALGCRSNLCDGDFLAGDLISRGAEVCGSSLDDLKGANAAVIVTCSVTAEADRKCRQLVRRARKTLGPTGIVAVCGCWAQALTVDTARELGINILAGTRGRAQLGAVILEALSGALKGGDHVFRDLRCTDEAAKIWEELPLQGTGLHTRAFVKVQEGCAHFCSYCIIPFLRGRPVSRPIENVRDEIKRLVDQGCREIVLTGTHLGAWGRDLGLRSLATLIKSITDIPGLMRLRMGSLEPFALVGAGGELLSVLADCPMFMPHLHLPLQSGDDEVLARMHRGYTARDFVQVCENARSRLGEALHISSDILVGFPGESDAAFENTLNTMREAGLGRVHVFPFSVRVGTIAATLPDAVRPDVKAKRTERAITLGTELLDKYASRFVGRTVQVLSEGYLENNADTNANTSEKKFAHGYTGHYLETVWPVDSSKSGEAGNLNELIRVRVDAVRDGGLVGQRFDSGC